ncbi:GDP-L-fucose synthase family protein [Nitratifractor sp.]
MNQKSKIFVAGGTGLVGGAIVRNLLEKRYTNIVANCHHREPMPLGGVRYLPLDLLDPSAVEKFFEEEKPEYVFLAAAKVGGIVANNTYRADFIYQNLQIQNHVIHQSYRSSVKKLMFLGSTCIYPKECPQPIKEEYLLTGELEYTNEPYAIAKIAGIKMCESYNLQYGTDFVSVMPTNLYGPGDNFDLEKSHVLPALIRKIHLGKALENSDWETIRKDLNNLPIEGIDGNASDEDMLHVLNNYGIKTNHASRITDHAKVSIEIWGSGRPMREFLWSEDMADACVFLMERVNFEDIVRVRRPDLQGDEIRNTHINIGTGKDIAIKDLAHLIKGIVGFGGDFCFNTEKPDGTMKKLTDVSTLHGLGWRHRMELTEGIGILYQWYLQQQQH